MKYTVTRVEEAKRWKSKRGEDFVTYDVGVVGEDGVPCQSCMLNQKDTTPAPLVDQVIEGWIEDTDYGQKLNKIYNQGGGSSTATASPIGGSQGATSQSNGDTQVSIERQSMVKAAAEFLAGQTKDPAEVVKAAGVFLEFVKHGAVEPMTEIDKHMAAMAEAEPLPFDQERP